MKKRSLALILASFSISTMLTACGDTPSSTAESSAIATSEQESVLNSNISIQNSTDDFYRSMADVYRSKVVVSDKLLDEYIKLLDNKQFKANDTLKLDEVPHADENEEEYNNLLRLLGNAAGKYDDTTKVATFKKDVKYTLSYDETYIYIHAYSEN